MSAAEPNITLDVALAYAADGWPVFPCRGDKKPCTHNGHLDASTDPSEVRRLWRRSPGAALIGSPTGFGFVVLDIDVREDRDGFATLARLLDSTALPETLTAATPSGGRHLYFEVPDPPIRNTAGERGRGIGPGLDWRGQGGYVIRPATGTGWVEETIALPLARCRRCCCPSQPPSR
jgi:bifunctional DNA primase/polymerase-like protein